MKNDVILNRIGIHILQAPSEQRSAKKRCLSSVPLLQKFLNNVNVHVYNTAEKKKLPSSVIKAIDGGSAAFLFPSKDSVPLTYDSCITHLIVPDASWPVAFDMLKNGDGRLRPNRIRHVKLPEGSSISLYEELGVRKEPAVGFMSTLEATAEALMILEPLSQPQRLFIEFEKHLQLIKQMEGCEERSADIQG